MSAALRALTAILSARSVHSPAVPAPAAIAPETIAADRQLLNQKILWDKVCGALTPGNIVLAEQETSYYGMAGHRLPAGVT